MAEGLTGRTPIMNWESGDLPGAWKTFQTHCEFMFKGPLKKKEEEEKCAYLMIWIGEQGRNVYSTWTLSADDRKKLDKHYEKFEAYVKPKSNQVFSSYKFHSRIQKPTESVEEFVTDLKVLVKDCGYENPDRMVRDRIVFGTKSSKVREKLINEGSDLTLEKALDIARTYEMSQKQLQTMNTGEDPNVNVIKKRTHQRPENKYRTSYSKQSTRPRYEQGARPKPREYNKVPVCQRCGYEHKYGKCPATGKTCNKCNKKDHFAKMCRTSGKPNKHVHEIDTDDNSYSDTDSDTLFVGALYDENNRKETWCEEIAIQHKVIKFQLDTGAKCNVLTRNDFKTLNIRNPLKKAESRLKSFSGHNIECDGMINLPITVKNKKHHVEFYVANTNSQSVLGAETCTEVGLIKRVYGVESQYPDLFTGLGCLPGIHKIHVDKSVNPVVHPPRKVPVALKGRIKQELERMEKLDVIVRQKEPTPWVNSMVTVVKPNGNVRICIDPKDLNKAIQRSHYPMRTVEEVVSNIPNAKVFSKIDATSGFWHLKLDQESSKLTCFNTPFGRYRFLRAPFGIKSIPEIFQRVMTELMENIEGAEVIVDDILIWGSTQQEHDERLKKVLERARQCDLKLSKSKCQFRRDEVEYVGHIISKDGLKPDPEKVRAVKMMKKPENKKDLQTFLGFITYLSKFLPNMSDVSAPLRILLEEKNEWFWEKEQEESFSKLKDMATNAPVLVYYDPKQPLTLNVDASSQGLGAVLLQNEKPIAYASRALTPTQQRYAQIEKETLAIVFGCQKFHHYIYGRPVEVESDHKPLENIFGKPLNQAPPRIQRFVLQLQKYDISVTYKPGKTMYVSDTLSRMYLHETHEKLVPDLDINEIQLNAHLPISPEKYEQFKKETKNDNVMQLLKKTVENGWPSEKSDLPEEVKPYWQFQNEITSIDNLMYKGQKLIIPENLRKEMLNLIHESHLGIVKCKTRAREFVYWPGLMSDIQDKVEKCEICATSNKKTNHKEPMIASKIPDRPSSKIAADLFQYKDEHYLLTVDYYSKWPEVDKLDSTKSANVICYLKKQMSRFGYIDQLITDNGPQFSSDEFARFAKDYGFIHTTTSPHFPQANGQAERFVQTVKNLIKKSNDPYKALLDYRNTPLDGLKLSPAQLHIGRRLKSSLPTTSELLKPTSVDERKVKNLYQKRQQKQEYYFNKHSGTSLRELKNNETVTIEHNKQLYPGKVIAKHGTPRSYIVETLGGQRLRRNRKHLKATKAVFQPESEIEETFKTNTYQTSREDIVKEKPQQEQLNTHDTTKEISEQKTREENPYCTRSGRVVRKPDKLDDFVCNKIEISEKEIYV